MDEAKKKQLKILTAAVCVVAAIIVAMAANRDRTIDVGPKTVSVICTSPGCGAIYEIDREKSNELTEQNMMAPPMPTEANIDDGSMPEMGVPSFACSKCGENTAQLAVKCEKCDNVFLPDYKTGSYDKCPGCGYSKAEDILNKTKQ